MKAIYTWMCRPFLGLLVATLLIAPLTLFAFADAPDYTLDWWTVDGGGYSLRGTAGQPEAGPALTSSGYTQVGGFWGGSVALECRIYLPLVLKNR